MLLANDFLTNFIAKFIMRFAITINSKDIFPIITLTDTFTQTEAEIYAFGALLNAFKINIDTAAVNIVDGFPNANEAFYNITNGFKSAKLSPFTCRMEYGEYSLKENDYKIEKFYLGEHAIHGIIYDSVFEVLTTHADDNSASVGLKMNYSATDKGYPFAFELLVNWKLEKDNKLSVKTTVIHHNNQPIPYADGWHPYFTLGNSVNNYMLQFDSNTMLEFDGSLIPTGNTITDTRFINGIALNDIFLDNCFVLQNGTTSKCTISNHQLSLTIQPDINYPYLQLYTPDHRNSIAIENLSGAPDCFNNGIGLLLLEPNKLYSFSTSYTAKKI